MISISTHILTKRMTFGAWSNARRKIKVSESDTEREDMTLREIIKVIKDGRILLKEKDGGYIVKMKPENMEKYIAREILDKEIEEIRALNNEEIIIDITR